MNWENGNSEMKTVMYSVQLVRLFCNMKFICKVHRALSVVCSRLLAPEYNSHSHD